VLILAVLFQAAREVYRRLMDAVDPALVDQAEETLKATPGVLAVGLVRLRWVGRRLWAECEIMVDGDVTAVQAHEVTVKCPRSAARAAPAIGCPGPREPGTCGCSAGFP
jgi:divalent metal cation (Fe/Co/Zn/Cd) transporter